jgi:hypothetical protein
MGLSAPRTSLEIKHPNASAKMQTTLCIINLMLSIFACPSRQALRRYRSFFDRLLAV